MSYINYRLFQMLLKLIPSTYILNLLWPASCGIGELHASQTWGCTSSSDQYTCTQGDDVDCCQDKDDQTPNCVKCDDTRMKKPSSPDIYSYTIEGTCEYETGKSLYLHSCKIS